MAPCTSSVLTRANVTGPEGVRPFMARLFEAPPAGAMSAGAARLSDQSGGEAPALAAPHPKVAGPRATAGTVAAEADDAGIDINQVEGRVRASSLKKVGEIVDKHPDETVSILRSWMFQES